MRAIEGLVSTSKHLNGDTSRPRGVTDEAFLQRMVQSHAERYGEPFWDFFTTHVAGCRRVRSSLTRRGRGSLSRRSASAIRRLPCMATTRPGDDCLWPAPTVYKNRPTRAVHDVATQPLPLVTGSVHLVCMTSVLHLFDDPFPVLAEVHRLLAPTGLFTLHDGIRRPLPDHLAGIGK